VAEGEPADHHGDYEQYAGKTPDRAVGVLNDRLGVEGGGRRCPRQSGQSSPQPRPEPETRTMAPRTI
jgi:hypothetical protein